MEWVEAEVTVDTTIPVLTNDLTTLGGLTTVQPTITGVSVFVFVVYFVCLCFVCLIVCLVFGFVLFLFVCLFVCVFSDQWISCMSAVAKTQIYSR